MLVRKLMLLEQFMLECFLLSCISKIFNQVFSLAPYTAIHAKGEREKKPFTVQIDNNAFLYLSSLLVVLLVTQSGEVDARLTRL